MPVEVLTSANWTTFAFKCRAAGDGGLMKEVRRDIRAEAKGVGDAVKAAAADYMPNRYAADVAGSLRITVTATGQGVALRGRARTSSGKPRELRKLEAGVLRHTIYGRWRKGEGMQTIRSGFWTGPSNARRDNLRRAVKGAMDRVATRIAA